MAGCRGDRAVEQPLNSLTERALRDAARLGPFFTIHLPGQAPDDVDWRPFGASFDQLLAEHMAALAGRLGTDQPRPVASILHLGAASAMTAPLLAAAATEGVVPAPAPEDLLLGFREGGPLQLALVAIPGSDRALLPELAEQLIASLERLIGAFTDALTATVPLPEKTLQGNVFSALAAAALLVTPPPAGARARALVDLVSRRHPPLADAGTLHWRANDAGDPRAYFRRRNCCLFYRIPGGGICGDCILSR